MYFDPRQKSVESQVADKDELEIMKLHINELDELSKEILILKYVQDMTYAEISEITGLSIKNVDIRLFRTKKKSKN